MKLLLIRHAECEMNAENEGKDLDDMVLGGGGPLTEKGIEQCHRLRELYASCIEQVPDFVACSKTERAQQTAEHSGIRPYEESGYTTISYLGGPGRSYIKAGVFEIDARLNEQHKGVWEGKRHGDVITPEVQKQLCWDYPHGGSESRADVAKRGNQFLNERVIGQGHDIAVLFTHQNFIRNIVTCFLGLPKEKAYQMHIDNCSMFNLEFEGNFLYESRYFYLTEKRWSSQEITCLNYDPTARGGKNVIS